MSGDLYDSSEEQDTVGMITSKIFMGTTFVLTSLSGLDSDLIVWEDDEGRQLAVTDAEAEELGLEPYRGEFTNPFVEE